MNTNMDFKDKVCLVTGAGSPDGIGFATARIIGNLGGKVAVTATTERIYQRASELKNEGIEASGYICDLMDRKQVAALIDSVQNDYEKIDILVNNAGMVQAGSNEAFIEFAALKDEDWDTAISRNLTTCFNITKKIINGMIRRKYGRVVNVSSVTGPLVSNPGESAYGAAKAAMAGMSRGIAIETAKSNITVNCVAPGWIATGSQTAQEAAAAMNTPMGRAGTAEEVANVIAFLASDLASYITGQLYVVDGGNILQEYKGPREEYY